MQYSREGTQAEMQDYAFFNQQYATSTYNVPGSDRTLDPDLIVQPRDDDDIIQALRWAKSNGVAIATKSGGHQYSGASSTSGKNIQIDLSNTYKDLMIIEPKDPIEADRALVYVGVSNHLMDFNAYLTAHQLFVPHGQCAYVGVGGHGQTGGVGQLGRSFGLFGDHIVTIRMICNDESMKDITKEKDPELFWAILGGSPGNFGIITHYIVKAYRDSGYAGTVSDPTKPNYNGPRGLKGLFVYKPETLTKLLGFVAQMAADPDFPRGVDICVSVLSVDFDIAKIFPTLNDAPMWKWFIDQIKKVLPEEDQILLNGSLPALTILYAQWCPTKQGEQFDGKAQKIFADLQKLHNLLEDWCIMMPEFKIPMSQMTGKWIFPKKREFDLPYVKRAYSTNATNLNKNGWAQKATDRIDMIYGLDNKRRKDKNDPKRKLYELCKLSVQIQCYGGNNSRYFINKDNGTSYNWRDTSVIQVLDCFHEPSTEGTNAANQWQTDNDTAMISEKEGIFSKGKDRRFLWGSHGDWDLGKESIWKCYYDDAAKYQKLGKVRGAADPNGTFTANPFAVKAIL